MREVYSGFTNLKTQIITITLGQGKELVVNVLRNPENLLIYKKIAKKTIKQIIYIPINPALLLRLIIKKPNVYGHK